MVLTFVVQGRAGVVRGAAWCVGSQYAVANL